MNGLARVAGAALAALEQAPHGERGALLTSLRHAAAARVRGQGLPTIAQEEWKYTSLAALDSASLRAAQSDDGAAVSVQQFAALDLSTASPLRVVLVNGRLRADLSTLKTLPRGLRVESIAALANSDPERLAGLVTADAGSGSTMHALNTALLGDGVLIETDAQVRIRETLHLIIINSEGGLLLNPRVLLRVARDSELRLVEEYVSVGPAAGLTNSVCEIVLASGATLFHHRLQTEALTSNHVGRVAVMVGEHANYVSDSLAFGGQLTRIDIDVALAGRGARCRLHGLFVADGAQHIDHHTRVDHLVGDTHSVELYRGILDGRSRGVFNGKVIVARDAQQISAQQTSNNLLLSRQAEIDTKPELEIYADDVSCTHGATVGELDGSALFYLRSRGIAEKAARALLTYAFAQKIVDDIPLPGVRRWLENRFLGHTDSSQLQSALSQP